LRSGRIRVDTVDADTGELLKSRTWPLPEMPFVFIPVPSWHQPE
jgi:hypothetical protein